MYSLFLALRYLRANRIMDFAAGGVAIGIAVMVVVTSLMGGFSRDLRERIRGLQSHLTVMPDTSRGYTETSDSLLDGVRKIEQVAWAGRRLEYGAWMGVQGSRRPVRLIGLDLADGLEAPLEEFFRRGGTDPAALRGDWVVAGWELPVEVGRSCPLLTATEDAEGGPPSVCIAPRDGLSLVVAGKFRSGLWEYDTTTVFLPIDRLRALLRLKRPAVSALCVMLKDYDRDQRAVAGAIYDLLDAEKTPGAVRRWEDAKRNLLRAVDSEKSIQIIILFFIVLVASFTIFSIYMMMVRAKRRDIGVLRALGATGPGVTRIFILSGALCGFAGSVVGVAVGLFVATSLDGFTLYVRAVSRGLAAQPGWEAWAALLAFLLSGAAMIAGWRKLRDPASWKWSAAAAAFALAGYHFLSHWSRGYVPQLDLREPLPGSGFPLGVTIWLALSIALTAWRRPASIIAGNAGLAAVLALLSGIAASVALSAPEPGFPGFDLFPRQVYHLDHVPSLVDAGWIVSIVGVTLAIGAVAAVGPAVRASLVDPLEAIRDE